MAAIIEITLVNGSDTEWIVVYPMPLEGGRLINDWCGKLQVEMMMMMIYPMPDREKVETTEIQHEYNPTLNVLMKSNSR